MNYRPSDYGCVDPHQFATESGSAVGLVYSASRLAAMFSGFTTAFFLKETGVGGVFVAITISMLIVIAAIGGFGPRPEGRALDNGR